MKYFLILTFVALVTACTTTYKPEGYGGGYTDMPLGGGKYNITVRGNGYTGLKQVQDIAMVRAAVIAKTEGDGYFLIINNNQDTKVHSTGYGSTDAYGNYSQSNQSYKNHYHTITIQVVPKEEAQEAGAISSESIISRLGGSVGYQP